MDADAHAVAGEDQNAVVRLERVTLDTHAGYLRMPWPRAAPTAAGPFSCLGSRGRGRLLSFPREATIHPLCDLVDARPVPFRDRSEVDLQLSPLLGTPLRSTNPLRLEERLYLRDA